MAPKGRGYHGGFNPFRDAHGRWAAAASANRAALAASAQLSPLPPKIEWHKDGVAVEFSGGRTPTYRVTHLGQVIAEVRATAKWRQELKDITAVAEAHRLTVQTAQANAKVRERSGRDPYAPLIAALHTAGAAAAQTPTDHEALTRVGAQARQALEVFPAVRKLIDSYNEVCAQLDNARQAGDKFKIDLYQTKRKNAQDALARETGQQFLQLLERIRPLARMEDVLLDHAEPYARDLLEEIIPFFPRDWAHKASQESSRGGGLSISIEKNIRAGYLHADRSITIDSTDGRSVMAHELNHWFEDCNPALKQAARAFLKHRTGSDKPQLLSILTGSSGYQKDEVAVPDHFAHPYMGRQYRNGGTETLTMMAEDLLDSRYDTFWKDPSMLDWYFGVLISL